MSDLKTILRFATTHLSPSETARLDAEILLAYTLALSRSDLLLGRAPNQITPDQITQFDGFITRRANHEPIGYIVGHREFWSLDFFVGPGVLIPRPDSEVLIETAIDLFKAKPPQNILDLGTGPGTLLLSALSEFSGAQGLGIDASETALAYAERNAAALGLADRATFQLGDWAQGLHQSFDLILCNPPYISTSAQLMADVQDFEPASALFAEDDGMAAYREIVPALAALLNPGAIVLVELGHDQSAAFASLAAAHQFECAFRADLAGHLRCAILRRG
jgi:release factor glutamine methyltransferase